MSIIFLSLILLAGCGPHWGTTSRVRSTLGNHIQGAVHTGEPHPGCGPYWGTTSRQLQTIDLQTHCLDISVIKMFESSESTFEQTESSLSCTPDAGMYLVKPLLSSNQMAIIPKRRQDPVRLWVDWICQSVSTSTQTFFEQGWLKEYRCLMNLSGPTTVYVSQSQLCAHSQSSFYRLTF